MNARAAVGLGAAQVVGQAAGLGMALVLARRLGVAGFGEYALVSAVFYVANVATTFGTDMALVRDIAASRQVRGVGAALVVQMALSLLAVAVMWLVAPLLAGGRSEVVTAMHLMSLALLPGAVFGVATAVLRGVDALRVYASLGVASALLPAVAVVALVPNGAGVVRAAVVLVAAQVAVGVAAWAACMVRVRGLGVVAATTGAEVREMLRSSAPIAVLGGLGMAYQRLPVIAVGVVAGPVATGWLTCALRTVEASKTAHVGMFSAVYPSLARAATASADDHAVRRRDLRHSWWLSVGLGAVVSLALLLLAPLLVPRLFGAAFLPSVAGLRILALAVVPSTVATYVSLQLLARHREATTLRVLGASLGVLAAGIAVLLPALGWIGVCWAVLVAESLQAALMLAATQPRVRIALRNPMAVWSA